MSVHACPLGPIHLVLHSVVWQDMSAQKAKRARWPATPTDLESDLRAFVQGVPALVQRGRGEHEDQPQILVCTQVYYLLAVQSSRNDAYFVPWMKPLDLHHHERLTRGALLLQATEWHVHTDYDTIPKGNNSGLAQILEAWRILQSQIEEEIGRAHV